MIVVDEDATLELQVKTVKVRPTRSVLARRMLTLNSTSSLLNKWQLHRAFTNLYHLKRLP